MTPPQAPGGDPSSTPLARARAEAEFFRMMSEDFDHGTVVFDDDGTVRYASPVVEEFLGRPMAELLGTNIVDHLDPDEVPHAMEALAWAMEHPGVKRHPVQLHFTREGHRRLVEVTSRVLRYDPRVRGLVVFLRDVTHESTLDHILDSVMRGEPVDTTLQIIAGLVAQELQGGVVLAPTGRERHADDIRAVGVDPAIVELYRGDATGTPWGRAAESGELCTQATTDLSPALRPTAEAAGLGGCWSAPLRATDGSVLGCLTVWTTEPRPPSPGERAFTERLTRLAGFALQRWESDRATEEAAHHDPATGLTNRIELAAAIERARADGPGRRRAVLLVELDALADLREEHGHLAADRLLADAAENLRGVLRADDLVARIAGDRFAVLCAAVADDQIANEVARRIAEAVRMPMVVGGSPVALQARIGIAFDDGSYRDPLTVLADAEAALDEVGDDGRGCRRVAAAARPVIAPPLGAPPRSAR